MPCFADPQDVTINMFSISAKNKEISAVIHSQVTAGKTLAKCSSIQCAILCSESDICRKINFNKAGCQCDLVGVTGTPTSDQQGSIAFTRSPN